MAAAPPPPISSEFSCKICDDAKQILVSLENWDITDPTTGLARKWGVSPICQRCDKVVKGYHEHTGMQADQLLTEAYIVKEYPTDQARRNAFWVVNRLRKQRNGYARSKLSKNREKLRQVSNKVKVNKPPPRMKLLRVSEMRKLGVEM